MTIFILSFLCISFGYSLFEKLKDKKGYSQFLGVHLKNEHLGNLSWWFLVTTNSVTTITILLAIYFYLSDVKLYSEILVYKICAINILILLFGQRIAGDFQGAANLGIYMILTILGWYLQIH